MSTEDTNQLVRQSFDRGFSIFPGNRDKKPRLSIAAAHRLAPMPHNRALRRQ